MTEQGTAQLERRLAECIEQVQRLEAELRQARASQAVSARRASDTEALFQALPDLVAVIDCEHRIVRINERMADRLNVSVEEAVGRRCHELMHGSQMPPGFCPHSMVLDDVRTHSAEVYEPTLDAFFLVSASPLIDSGGRLVGSVRVARELPDRRAGVSRGTVNEGSRDVSDGAAHASSPAAWRQRDAPGAGSTGKTFRRM